MPHNITYPRTSKNQKGVAVLDIQNNQVLDNNLETISY